MNQYTSDLITKASKYIPGASYFTLGPNLPGIPEFIIEKGYGPYVYTTDGVKMLDVTLAHGSLILGHSNKVISEAVRKQIALGTALTNITKPAIELAELMVEIVPCADKVRIVNSGTEASILAIRLVRAATGKEKILKFEGAYHGFADNLIFNTNYGKPNELCPYPEASPDSLGVSLSQAKTVLIAPYNNLEITSKIIDENIHDLAGIIVEPVMRGINSRPEFLKGLKVICDKYKIPLIFDEVITGFRGSLGGAQEYFGVTPDLSIYGKSLGAGYPIGAIVGKDSLMKYLDPSSENGNHIFSIGSFHSNPLCSTAALYCLKELKKNGSYEKLNNYGDGLRSGLSQIFEQYELPHVMTGLGSIIEFFFTSGAVTDYKSSICSNLALKDLIGSNMYKFKVVGGGGRYTCSIMHGEKELDWMLSAVSSTLDNARSTGVLNRIIEGSMN